MYNAPDTCGNECNHSEKHYKSIGFEAFVLDVKILFHDDFFLK
jgi:hypothetical protein